MTRQSRTFTVLAIALLAAFASSLGVYRVLANMPVKQVEVASTYAVVATHAMPMGTRLTPDSVTTIPWPARAPISGSFSDVKQVLDRGLIVGVAANEPLTEAKLAPVGAGAGLPPAIPDGMRAISVKVDEVVGVAGFVVPGTHVDVIATVDAQLAQVREKATRVIVPNALVIAAGTRYDQEAATREGKAIPSTVVTVVVVPDDAQRIALASAEGELMLALRNPLDVASPDTKAIGLATLIGMPAAVPVRAAAPARKLEPKPVTVAVAPVQAPPPPYTVEAIRAATRTEEVVR